MVSLNKFLMSSIRSKEATGQWYECRRDSQKTEIVANTYDEQEQFNHLRIVGTSLYKDIFMNDGKVRF